MTKYTLSVANKKIYNFYNENPNLNFEAMNLLLIDILSKLGENMDSAMKSTIQGEILSNIQNQTGQLTSLVENMNTVKENVLQISKDTSNMTNQLSNISQLKNDIDSIMTNKMHEMKSEYLSGFKSLLLENMSSNKNDIVQQIEQNSSVFYNNITHFLSDTMMKDIREHNEKLSTIIENNQTSLVDKNKLFYIENQEKYSNQIETQLKNFQTHLSNEVSYVTKNQDETSMKDFVVNFDTKCASLFQNLQQPVFSYLSSSEDRIQQNINVIKDSTINKDLKHESTMSELSIYLKKFQNSSFKGAMAENELATVLTKMYPCAEIVNTANTKASGDFLMKRENLSNIMLENKAYEHNVNPDEVAKFIRDAEETKTHSIFLSQTSGISRKNNMQVDIHKGLILIYIHNVQYSREKIQVAIDIIDNLSHRIDEFENQTNENVISNNVLEQINQEYRDFIKERDDIVSISKEYNKKIISKIENLHVNTLNQFLSTKFSNTDKVKYTCHLCNVFTANTKKSLSAHSRACKLKHPHDSIVVDTNNVVVDTNNVVVDTNNVVVDSHNLDI